jgi:hypothetical protein
MKTTVLLASAALLMGGAVTAQTAAPADQTPAAVVTPVVPEAVPSGALSFAPPVVAAADGPVTKAGGKYVKDSRPATRTEIASFRKANKSRPM